MLLINYTPMPTTAKTLTKLGPGAYRPEGIYLRAEDLPQPKRIQQQRNYPSQPCPHCQQAAPRQKVFVRHLHDLGDLRSRRPHELEVTYSQHRCPACRKYFSADMSDLAAAGGQYTHRVTTLAVRLVVEDGLPYRAASWHLWRDHRVFVPFATIQNWVEAGGKKGK